MGDLIIDDASCAPRFVVLRIRRKGKNPGVDQSAATRKCKVDWLDWIG